MVKIHWIESPEPEAGRTYKMFLEGMRNNPQVERVDRHEDADWVFMHHMAYCLGVTYDGPLEKLVVINFRDMPKASSMPKGARAYFIRSWHGHERNEAGFFEKIPRTPPWPDNFFPLTMCAMEDFFLADPPAERDIDVTCCLRNGFHNRRAVRQELEAYFAGKDYVTQFGPINDGGRNDTNEEYLRTLARSKVVVTCQPDRWEGDWRTWEAFASGALVFTDTVYVEGHSAVAPECATYHFSHGLNDLGKRVEAYLSMDPIPSFQSRTDKAAFAHMTGDWLRRAIGEWGAYETASGHRSLHRIDYMLACLERQK